jgi:hypothetical protein
LIIFVRPNRAGLGPGHRPARGARPAAPDPRRAAAPDLRQLTCSPGSNRLTRTVYQTLVPRWADPQRGRLQHAVRDRPRLVPTDSVTGSSTAALHVIAVSRMRSHPPTLAYLQRRRTEGKTDREIRRCIKRYLARHLYRALNNA